MGFERTEIPCSLRQTIREFAETELKPGSIEREKTGEFPLEAMRKLGKIGMLGLIFPKRYGGQGLDVKHYTVVVEELAYHDPSAAITLVAHTLCASHINIFGTVKQKERYLTPLASGEQLGAWAFAEPNAKDGTGLITTSARVQGNEWRITGNKSFVTNGSVADSIVVLASTTGTPKTGDFSSFIVPGDSSGLDRIPIPTKSGFHTSGTVSLKLNGLRIPQANLLGAERQGLIQVTEVCAISKMGVAAMAIGIGRGSLEGNTAPIPPFERSAIGFQATKWILNDKPARLKKLIVSQREKQVLQWLKQGKSSWDISVILGISERTVYFHVSNIMKKLEASNRPQAVAIAAQLGLID